MSSRPARARKQVKAFGDLVDEEFYKQEEEEKDDNLGKKRKRQNDDEEEYTYEKDVEQKAAIDQPSKKKKIETFTPSSTSNMKYSPAQIKKFSSDLFKEVKKSVKKEGHNRQKKPWCQEVSAVWPMEVFNALFGELPSSVSRGMIKLTPSEEFVVTKLGWDRYIDGCKFDGKAWVRPGQHFTFKATAGYDTIEVRYTVSNGLLKVKVRTYMANI